MNISTNLNATFLSLTLLLSTLSTSAKGQWFFEAGPFYRGDISISVDGGSRASDEGSNASAPGVRGGMSAPVSIQLNDDGSTSVFRSFDNGYVGPSDWIFAQNAGITQYFGYETADQYDAGTDTLRFNRTLSGSATSATRTTTRTTNDGSSGWNDSARTDGVGIIATLGYRFGEEEDPEAQEETNHEWALLFRFGWLEGMGANFRNRQAFSQSVSRRTETFSASGTEVHQYTYDTLGNPFFPTAPYAMTDPGGVGPLIADTPESITLLSRTDTPSRTEARTSLSRATSFVDVDLDVRAFTFQIGPRWLWCPQSAVSLYLQPAVTLNRIDASAHRTETFRDQNGREIASWRDRADDESWRWGGGIQAGATVGLSENWYLNGSGGYEWVHSTELVVGPDRVHIDISGYQFEVALGRNF